MVKYVAVNKTEKTLLFGIRGTASQADAITDCISVAMPHACTPYCPFTTTRQQQQQQSQRDIFCHEGVLRAARNMCDKVYEICPCTR